MKKVNIKFNRSRLVTLIIILPILLIGAAEILAIISSHQTTSYAITELVTVEALSEVAIWLLIAAYVLSFFIKGKIYSIVFDVVRLGVVAMLCYCFYTVISERADLMGYVWFSDLESGNQTAVNALNYGVASGVLYVVGIISLAGSAAIEFVNAGIIKRTREEIESDTELQSELASIDNA